MDNPQQVSPKDGLALVLMRNAFYRDNYNKAILVLIVLFLINLVLLIAIIYRWTHPPQPQYFATNPQYQLIQWKPLSDPDVSENFIKQWVTTAVGQAFSLDFIHWREQLFQASKNFTPNGWYWFLNAFKKSGDLDSLVKLNMVSNAEVTGAPVIISKGVLDGRYEWKISMPILITYTNTQKTIRQPLKVTLTIVRVPVQDNPNHVAIHQFLPVSQGGSV